MKIQNLMMGVNAHDAPSISVAARSDGMVVITASVKGDVISQLSIHPKRATWLARVIDSAVARLAEAAKNTVGD